MAVLARRSTAPRRATRDTVAHTTRRGLWGIARLVALITAGVVALIVIGIVLVLVDANRNNEIIDWLVGAAGWLAEPFDNVFKLDDRKDSVAVNYGLAALVYALVGGLIVRLLRR
jgi:hypothetical protein